MPTANTKPKVPPSATKSTTASSKSSQHGPNKQTKAGFIATGTGPKLSKVRTTRVTNYRTRRPDPEERKRIARMRWKKAIRRVKAMLLFKIPINFKDDDEKEPVKLAPTYKMTPDPGKKFNPRVVEELIGNVLSDRLQEYEYSRFTAPKFAKVLSALLNDKLKEFDFPRYKFVTNVVIGENKNQSVCFTSRCVWDAKTDGYATAQYKRPTFIAVASIHGVYLD